MDSLLIFIALVAIIVFALRSPKKRRKHRSRSLIDGYPNAREYLIARKNGKLKRK